MTVRQRIRLAALLPVLCVLIIGILLRASWNQVDNARQGADLAERIRSAVADLNSLTQENLLYGTPRVAVQMRKTHDALAELVTASSFQEAEQRELLERISHGYKDLVMLSTLLLEKKAGAKEQIAGAIMVKVHDLRQKARELAEAQHDKVVAIQREVDRAIMLALVVLAGLSTYVLTLVTRRVVLGMDQMAEGIQRLERDDLAHSVSVTGNDELSALGHAFNQMKAHLRDSYTTIEQLKREILERERAERATRESEERLRLFIEHAPASLAMFERNMRYLAVSRRWLNDYRLGGADILGRSHYEVFPEIPERWMRVHQRGLAGEVITADEDRFERADGSVQWLRWEVRPWRTAEGGVGGIVIFTEDVTRLIEARREILRLNDDLDKRVVERTAELSAANRELDSFAHAVSHDLRAPLRAMSGYSLALLQDYGDRFRGEPKVWLDHIVASAQRMNDLIDGLLTLARTSRCEMQRDRVDISALTGQLLDELARSDPGRSVAAEVAPGLAAFGDPRLLESVLRNLLGNAWKFTARVPAPQIRLYGETRQGQPWICVADNGAGFDPAYAARLFQPFQRLHRQDEFSGSGIGLATVQRIVHRHGGEIAARGEPGKGAVFCFSLPGRSSASHVEKPEDPL